GEHEARHSDEERRDAVLDVVVAGPCLVPGEEAGQGLGRLDPVHDRDHDEHDAHQDGEPGEETVVPHDAAGYASRRTLGRGHHTATHRSPCFWDAVTPRDGDETTGCCGSGSTTVPEP